jgi:hypothetical protein
MHLCDQRHTNIQHHQLLSTHVVNVHYPAGTRQLPSTLDAARRHRSPHAAARPTSSPSPPVRHLLTLHRPRQRGQLPAAAVCSNTAGAAGCHLSRAQQYRGAPAGCMVRQCCTPVGRAAECAGEPTGRPAGEMATSYAVAGAVFVHVNWQQ